MKRANPILVFNGNTKSVLLHIFEFWGLLLIAIGLVFLVRLAIRGNRIPVCYACGASKVRRSRSANVLDKIARVFLIRCYRCGGCQVRFRALPPFLESNRAVKVIFHYGDGFHVEIRSVDLANLREVPDAE